MPAQPFSILCGMRNPIHPSCPIGFSAYPDVDGLGVAVVYGVTTGMSPCAVTVTSVPPPNALMATAWSTGIAPPAPVVDAAHPAAPSVPWRPLPPHCWGWEGSGDYLKTTAYNFAGTIATVTASAGEYPFIQSIKITQDYDVRVQRRMSRRDVTYSIDFFGTTAPVSDVCTDLSSSDVTTHHTKVIFDSTLGGFTLPSDAWGSCDLFESTPDSAIDYVDSSYYDNTVTGGINKIPGGWGRWVQNDSAGIRASIYCFGREVKTTTNMVFTIHITWVQFHCAPNSDGGPAPCDCNNDCLPCTSNPPVKSGRCATLCADGGASTIPISGWIIHNQTGGVVASTATPNGWSVSQPSRCLLTICAPCLTPAQLAANNYQGPYTALWGTGDTCPCPGHPNQYKIFGVSFNLQADVICGTTTTPGGDDTAAIEADGPRQWVHVGRGSKITTYDNAYVPLFQGDYPVDEWRRLRADPRFGSLAALGRTYAHDSAGAIVRSGTATYSIWLSTDGGITANKVREMAATSSLLERDSERNWLLWFTADGTNSVSVQISVDGGQGYAAMVDVHDDTGARLQAKLQDTCQDCRSGGRVALVCELGKDPAVAGTAAIMVSDDGGLTFRKVV